MCKVISSIIIVLVNIPFLLLGLVFAVAGGIIKWSPNLIVDQIVPLVAGQTDNENVKDAAATLISWLVYPFGGIGVSLFTTGMVLICVALCGIIGVLLRNKWIMGIYVALLMLFLLDILISTIVFGVKGDTFKTHLTERLQNSIRTKFIMDNEKPPNSGFTLFMSGLQVKYSCCGAVNYKDYFENDSFKNQKYKIPNSCCKSPEDTNCWDSPNEQNSNMNKGCATFLWTKIRPFHSIILYVMIISLIVSALFCALAIYLLYRFSKSEMRSAS